jgi:putative drug exporter of the RND superfamily
MSRFLFRLGRSSARHPLRMIAAWLLAAVLIVSAKSAFGGETTDNFRLPGTESQQALDLLKERFPTQAGSSGHVVFHVPSETVTSPTNRAIVVDSLAALRSVPGVVAVTDPFDAAGPSVSADGRTAFTTVAFADETLQRSTAEAVLRSVEANADRGVQIETAGSIAAVAAPKESSEMVGLAVAVVVLLVAFGSVIAMGIPIGTALFGIFIGLAGVSVLAGAVDVPSVSPMLATMIGLGVGIDYALFVITRHRQFLHEGWSVVDAAGQANATAGQAVLFAGGTVVVAISGLFLSGIPSIGIMGLASGLVVAVAMIAAVTLLPAFLGLVGHGIDRLRVGRKHKAVVDAHHTVSGRWADRVGNRPWRYAVGALVLLVALAGPVLSLRVGFADDSNSARNSTQREAYELLSDGFGPGFNGPLTIVTENTNGTSVAAAAATITGKLRTEQGIAGVSPVQLNDRGDTAVLFAYPTSAPQSVETEQLVHDLRSDLKVAAASTDSRVFVSGWTAAGIDISERLINRTPLFIAAVMLLSFLLLMVLFRSVVVPLKAVLMNLLSIGASYGVLVAMFQWGWGKGLIGLDDTMPISPFVPMIMFAILFGLSMDYEVFLLSRVREEFVRTGDSHRSVVDGLASTARVITSAALIMISVFGAFIFSHDVELKMFGLGLATAVLIDATIVRMVLVPSTMALLGNANWWLPTWLDRVLPHVDVEGGVEREQERDRDFVPV